MRHFRAITQQTIPAPAVLLVQAPVFHGYAIAMFVQTGLPVTACNGWRVRYLVHMSRSPTAG